MSNLRPFLCAFAAAAVLIGTPAGALLRPGASEQDAAYRAAHEGRILPLPEIRARIRIRGAQLIGVEFDGRIYRLKFMRGAEVIWVDVDPRTGRILARF